MSRKTKPTVAEGQAAPVRLVWNAEEERLVPEVARRDKASRRLGSMVMGAVKATMPKKARSALLKGSSQQLTPAAQEALSGRYVSPADAAITLPVEHKVGDRSHEAMDESWQIRGTTKDGDVVITRAPGLLSHNLVVQGAMQWKRAEQRAANGGKWVSPHQHRNRHDQPIEDPGSTLYVVSPADIGTAARAHDADWAPKPHEIPGLQQGYSDWARQQHAAAVVQDAERILDNAAQDVVFPDELHGRR